MLGCVVPFSIVWCTGQSVCFCHDGLCLCIACFGCLSYHQRCVGVCSCGFGQERQGLVFIRKNGQLWAGQRWSDMNNMYGWLGGRNTCRGAGRLHLMALCISYLSPWRIAKEGLGIGMRGLWFDVVSRKGAFGWVSRLALASFISSICLVQAFTGRGGLLRVRTARR